MPLFFFLYFKLNMFVVNDSKMLMSRLWPSLLLGGPSRCRVSSFSPCLFVSLQMKTYVCARKFHWLIWLKPLRRRVWRSVRRIVTNVRQVTWGRPGPPISSHALKREIKRANGRPTASSVSVRLIDLFEWLNCTDADLPENCSGWSTLAPGPVFPSAVYDIRTSGSPFCGCCG